MKTGFIGMGSMAAAMLKGMTRFAGFKSEDICAYAPNQKKLQKNAPLLGFRPCSSAAEAVSDSECVILACKPYQVESVLAGLGSLLDGKVLISVAFGWDYEHFSQYLDTDKVRVQYIVPNTPVSVGEGIVLMEAESGLSPSERLEWKNILGRFSKVIELDSSLIPAGSAIAGCAPAFVDVFIESLADGGVKNGIPRDTAYAIIPQMIIGAAKLMQESGLHPGQLKDQVCSPGGTTIRGVAAMEEGGVRSSMIRAVDAACGK